MFSSAKAFNQNVGGWNTASVSNMSFVCLPIIAPAGIGRGPIGLRR
jgi:surface protein